MAKSWIRFVFFCFCSTFVEVDIMVWKLSWFMPRWVLMVIPCQIYGRNHVKGGCEQIIGRQAKVKKVEVDLMTSDFFWGKVSGIEEAHFFWEDELCDCVVLTWKTNMSTEKWWLEDYVPFEMVPCCAGHSLTFRWIRFFGERYELANFSFPVMVTTSTSSLLLFL